MRRSRANLLLEMITYNIFRKRLEELIPDHFVQRLGGRHEVAWVIEIVSSIHSSVANLFTLIDSGKTKECSIGRETYVLNITQIM